MPLSRLRLAKVRRFDGIIQFYFELIPARGLRENCHELSPVFAVFWPEIERNSATQENKKYPAQVLLICT